MQYLLPLSAALLAIQAAILYLMGQPFICECGTVKVWEHVVLSEGNSQHLADWYTFSHMLHGVIFFFAIRYFFPRLSWKAWLLIALCIEIAWEIIENTPMVIDHYRQQALAQGYTGDSILNSVSDTLAMVLGFFLALRLPWWAVAGLMLVLESFTLYMIRDGLALNIINLIHPIDAISAWQMK